MYKAYIYPKSQSVVIEDTAYLLEEVDGEWSVCDIYDRGPLKKKRDDSEWESYKIWEVEGNSSEDAVHAWTLYIVTIWKIKQYRKMYGDLYRRYMESLMEGKPIAPWLFPSC